MKIKLEGTKYSRDLSNMALICNDPNEVSKYGMEMDKLLRDKARDFEINSLKQELSQLKELLQHAMNNRG